MFLSCLIVKAKKKKEDPDRQREIMGTSKGSFYLRIIQTALAAVGAPENLVHVVTGDSSEFKVEGLFKDMQGLFSGLFLCTQKWNVFFGLAETLQNLNHACSFFFEKIKANGSLMQMVVADWLQPEKREDALGGRPGGIVQKCLIVALGLGALCYLSVLKRKIASPKKRWRSY